MIGGPTMLWSSQTFSARVQWVLRRNVRKPAAPTDRRVLRATADAALWPPLQPSLHRGRSAR